MNLKTLSRIFSWRYARYLLALIGILVLLLICLTGCKSSQKASESHYHRRQSLTSSDSSRTVDLSVIHDTLTILRTETLWREPDTLGNIYPLQTIATETTAKRQTDKNIVTIRADTIYMTDETNHVASLTKDEGQKTKVLRPLTSVLPWVLLLLVSVVSIVSIKNLTK